MKKINSFAAAAAAFAIAVTSTSCSAPSAVTIGGGTKTALTIDGYDVNAGIFIYNELNAYSSAAYTMAMDQGMSSYPTADQVKGATLEGKDATAWIQDKATEYCVDFVAVEKEFAKIGGSLTPEEKSDVNDTYDMYSEDDLIAKNGIGEESLRAVLESSYKQQHLFEYYYGIDSEYGCSEDELKQYYIDNTARVKYLVISLTDDSGELLGEDEQKELMELAEDYADEINSVSGDEEKMAKFDDVQQEYDDYQAAQTTTAEGETTTVTTTVTTAEDETTTTTTTDPYANEVTLTKATTTTTAAGETTAVTTTTTAEQAASQQAQKDFNDKVFGMDSYNAEVYKYDDETVYVLIKGDISARMTDDDLWSEDVIDQTLVTRYGQEFTDMMNKIADSYKVEKNNKAYRRYEPFKLTLEADSAE